MYHPETMYELAKLKMAEDLRYAERERMIRLAGKSETHRRDRCGPLPRTSHAAPWRDLAVDSRRGDAGRGVTSPRGRRARRSATASGAAPSRRCGPELLTRVRGALE